MDVVGRKLMWVTPGTKRVKCDQKLDPKWSVLTERIKPRLDVSFFDWKPISFFIRFSLPSTKIRWKWSPKTHLFKNDFESGGFYKHRLLVYVWSDKKSGLHILLAERILRKECYRIFTVLAFSCAGAKTFEYATCGWRRIFFENEDNSVFKSIRTCEDGA